MGDTPANPANAPPVPTPPVPTPAPRATDTGTEPAIGLQENGDLVVRLAGNEFRVTKADLAKAKIDLAGIRQPIPGLNFESAIWDRPDKKLKITAGLAVPKLAEGKLTVEIDRKGKTRFLGQVQRAFNLPALGPTRLTLGFDSDSALTGEVEVPAANLAPKGIPGLKASGSGKITLTGTRLSGGGKVDIAYADLGSGTVEFGFDDKGNFTGSGHASLTPPLLGNVTADLAADKDGNIAAHVQVPLGARKSPVPNLVLSAGTVDFTWQNGAPGLTLTDFAASYAGFASVTLETFSLDKSLRPSGKGAISVTLPMIDAAEGTLTIRNGKLSGGVRIEAKNFPKALPIEQGAISGTLAEDGSLGFKGKITATLGPAGKVGFAAAFGPDGFALSGEGDLTVPGLQSVHLSASYQNGDLAGEVAVPIDSEKLPGVAGNVTVRYAQGLWSGGATLDYSADSGKLKGSVTITLAQNDKGAVEVGGQGRVTAQLMPGLEGTLTAVILPEGGVDISGEIVVTEPYTLFPEQRTDKELFKLQQNIPLWAILVAVIRVRAGIRAGIGPGVFRNIKVTGSWTIGSDAAADPSFTVSGEMYIPAFVEGYVAFGAGLGLDVKLGSLTGGIEGVATAGLYGAVSVIPELSYEGGDWAIDGTATLAAGARLKLSLNAWAEIEALWITVWSETWKLAEVVMPVGPDLALQAQMHYVFGKPEPPSLEFKTSDIDTEALIRDAMPKDGPAGSGAREALENKAEWKGKLKEQKPVPVPPEQKAQAAGSVAPPAPAKPPPKGKPPAGTAPPPPDAAKAEPPPPATASAAPGATETPAAVAAAATPDPKAAGTVPPDAKPKSNAPRYPGGITMAMLDEPAVPAERTADEQKQDVEAARQVVDLASEQATDSDAIDDWFPQIKQRFRLTSIGWEGDFSKGFDVAIKINPATETPLKKKLKLKGLGLPAGMGHATKIRFPAQKVIAGDTVGLRMVAEPLGPDHPAGSGPKGQDTLMGKLPTGYSENPDAQSNYIRGHLLNDWLGGEGVPKNLFPITQHANTAHLAAIESKVKTWVNTNRFWVQYDVEIIPGSEGFGPKTKDNFVNATINAAAHVLDSDLSPDPVHTFAVSIESKFKVTPAVETLAESASTADLDSHVARQEDKALVVAGTSRDTSPAIITAEMVQDLAKALSVRGRTRTFINGLLATVPDLGPARLGALWYAYDLGRNLPDQAIPGFDSTQLASLTWIRNNWATIRKSLP